MQVVSTNMFGMYHFLFCQGIDTGGKKKIKQQQALPMLGRMMSCTHHVLIDVANQNTNQLMWTDSCTISKTKHSTWQNRLILQKSRDLEKMERQREKRERERETEREREREKKKRIKI